MVAPLLHRAIRALSSPATDTMRPSPLLRLPRQLVSALLLLGVPVVLPAQHISTEALHTRIRLDLHSADRTPLRRERIQSLTGSYLGVVADTVLLQVQSGMAPIRVPFRSIQMAYASRGRTPRWKAALRGAAVPALTGAALGTVASLLGRQDDNRDAMQVVASRALWGAASGGALAVITPKYRWQRLSTPVATPAGPTLPAIASSRDTISGARHD